jgi:IQ domain-containing protein H
VAHPKRILPKHFRDDPFADPPPITEDDISDGMFSLLNRGIIPKDVDLSPAFERGNAPFMFNKARMHQKPDKIDQSSKYVPIP